MPVMYKSGHLFQVTHFYFVHCCRSHQCGIASTDRGGLVHDYDLVHQQVQISFRKPRFAGRHPCLRVGARNCVALLNP